MLRSTLFVNHGSCQNVNQIGDNGLPDCVEKLCGYLLESLREYYSLTVLYAPRPCAEAIAQRIAQRLPRATLISSPILQCDSAGTIDSVMTMKHLDAPDMSDTDFLVLISSNQFLRQYLPAYSSAKFGKSIDAKLLKSMKLCDTIECTMESGNIQLLKFKDSHQLAPIRKMTREEQWLHNLRNR